MRFGMIVMAAFWSLVIVSASALTAYAAGISGTPGGNDVSYPQCGVTLPSQQAFGIVGVNEGLANTTNPCLADEKAWAPPLIPRKHLGLVQRGQVPDGVTAYLSWPPIAGPVDTELCGVNLAGAEGLPSLTAGEELTWAQVFRLRQDRLADDLGVDPHPPLVRLVPVLRDPVVEALPRLEVCGETAADSRCDAAIAQQRAAQHGEVPAGADHSSIRPARNIQCCRVQRQ